MTHLPPPCLHPGVLHGTQPDEVGGQVDIVGWGPGAASSQVGTVVEAEIVTHIGISEDEDDYEDEEDIEKGITTEHFDMTKSSFMAVTEPVLSVRQQQRRNNNNHSKLGVTQVTETRKVVFEVSQTPPKEW